MYFYEINNALCSNYNNVIKVINYGNEIRNWQV